MDKNLAMFVLAVAATLFVCSQAASKTEIRERRCATCEYVVAELQHRLSEDIVVSFCNNFKNPRIHGKQRRMSVPLAHIKYNLITKQRPTKFHETHVGK